MTHYKPYPFTAIVGQDLMKLALILNAINPKIGGVLIMGTKGTAKSTAVRALADLLPFIKIIKDCPFNCNPDDLKECCHDCQKRILNGKITETNTEFKKMVVKNLPINATEDRVVGTIDIKKALESGMKSLEPGILAEANRNILYIDEVNLLADNVADVLLDAAAMGVNIIEREGISIHHPAKFILVGTMNPEEGNLRPQLLDRFGLSVEAKPILEVDQRIEIIKLTEEYQQDPETFRKKYEHEQEDLLKKIIKARDLLDEVEISDILLKKIAQISIKMQIESHRADITINLAAKTIAAFKSRQHVSEEDIKIAAKLALNHRMRRLPFEEKTLNEEEIEELFEEPEEIEPEEKIENEKNDNKIINTKEKVFEIDESFEADNLLKLERSRDILNTSGKRIHHPTRSEHGKYIGGEKPRNFNFNSGQAIAVNETINNACLEIENRYLFENGEKLKIKTKNIQIKRRVGKSSYLIIFCVDASGSMGVQERMKSVKGIIFNILQSNYVYRDKVSLVVFRKDQAEVVLPPTRSTDLAYKLLKEIPTGGTTPLTEGLMKAAEVALEEKRKDTGYIPLIVLLSDARGNISYNDVIEDLIKAGEYIAKKQLNLIILDTEQGDIRLGFNKVLADASNGIYYHLDQINEGCIKEIFKDQGLLRDN